MKNILRVNSIGALFLAALMWMFAPDAPIADAAMRGDLTAVRSLVKEGADVNAAQGDGMTALHWAALNGNAEMAEVLVFAGARLESRTRLGSYTPLHLASKHAHAEVVAALLTGGAEVDATTSTGGVTPLHFAAGTGSVPVITALLDKGAEIDRAETEWGHTPLMFAAAYNRSDAIGTLLARGAKPGVTGRVIDLAKRSEDDDLSQEQREELRKFLKATPENRSASTPQGGGGGAGGGGNQQGAAAQPGAAEIPSPYGLVLRAMSQAEQIGGYGGLTALTLAAREGNVEAARALLDGGADIDEGTAGDGTTALLMASINGHFDLAMTLLERGADATKASDSGNTPLFATINTQWIPKSRGVEPADYQRQTTSYMDVVKAMIAAGADVNARLHYNVWHIERGSGYLSLDWTGATPFFRAAHALDLELMKLLVANGADPSITTVKTAGGRESGAADASGLPPVPVGGPAVYPIHVASGHMYSDVFVANVHRFVEDGWLPAVKYLVEEHGADVNARDMSGYTPLHNAAARGDNALIEYLVSKGADVTAVSRRGLTTVDSANGPQQRVQPFPATIKLLEGLGAKNSNKCVSC